MMPLLSQHDLLLMPTVPLKATPLPPADAPRELYIQRAFEMLANTAPFDATGHPAMSIPCGMSDGLPIGLMLIGKHYDESTIYRAAAAFEKVRRLEEDVMINQRCDHVFASWKCVSRAQHSTKWCAAVPWPSGVTICYDPRSAVHRFTLQRIRETQVERFRFQ